MVNRHSRLSENEHAPPHRVHLAELATAYRDIKTQLIAGAVDNRFDVDDLDMALQSASQSRRYLEQLTQASEACRDLASRLLNDNDGGQLQPPQDASAKAPMSDAGAL